MKSIKGFISGVITTLLVVALISTAFALNESKTIDVGYRDIKIEIDGKGITPKDANGNIVEPFIYNGTTYLPVRAVGEAMGYSVEWDNGTSTVKLAKKAANATSHNKTLLDRDGVTVTYSGIELKTLSPSQPDVFALYINLAVENNSENDIVVALTDASVNNVMKVAASGTPQYALSGKKASAVFFIGSLEGTGVESADDIDKIENIEFKVSVRDNSTFDELLTSDIITIAP